MHQNYPLLFVLEGVRTRDITERMQHRPVRRQVEVFSTAVATTTHLATAFPPHGYISERRFTSFRSNSIRIF